MQFISGLFVVHNELFLFAKDTLILMQYMLPTLCYVMFVCHCDTGTIYIKSLGSVCVSHNIKSFVFFSVLLAAAAASFNSSE